MPVRDLTTEDFVPYRAMTADAFGGAFDPSAPGAPTDFSPGESALGIVEGQGPDRVVAAGARIRHDRITLGGSTAACGGIGGLAVHPARRGDGLFRELLTAVIARCAAEGLPVSMLYPSHPEIYRRAGYQVVAVLQRMVIPLLDLQRLPAVPGRRLVPVTAGNMPRLHALYRELTAEDNGMLLREGPLFPDGLPGGGWSALLLEDPEGTAHGYLSWTRSAANEDGAGLSVHEILGRTRADRIALLRSLASWSTVTEKVSVRLRTEDPVLDVLPGGGGRPSSSTVPLLMMRVIDTAALLEARRAPAGIEGAFRLEVEDTTVPEGTCPAGGAWTVTAAGGAISVGEDAAPPSGSELGTVRLDVHAASLLLVGGRTLADARRLGLDVEADPAAERFVDHLLAGPRPSVLDAF